MKKHEERAKRRVDLARLQFADLFGAEPPKAIDMLFESIAKLLAEVIGEVEAEEREVCATIAETLEAGPIYFVDGKPNAGTVTGGHHIAQAIRARGEQE